MHAQMQIIHIVARMPVHSFLWRRIEEESLLFTSVCCRYVAQVAGSCTRASWCCKVIWSSCGVAVQK